MAQTLPSILIAENEHAVAKPLVAQLESAGFDVRWVISVRELRDEMEAHPPDVLILDDRLDIDGLEYLQAIRFAPNHPPGGVVIISDSVAARERGLQLGAAAAVAKPIAGDEMVRTLEELLAYI